MNWADASEDVNPISNRAMDSVKPGDLVTVTSREWKRASVAAGTFAQYGRASDHERR
jgi:hypothetical protein